MVFLSGVLFSCSDSSNGEITTDMINYPGDEGPKPIMTFDSIEHHFGKVAIGDPVNFTYRFKNTGEAPLALAHVNPSCGCTVIKSWPKEPIMPGAVGEIVGQLNTTNLSGFVKKNISILSNTIPAVTYLDLLGEVVGKEVPLNNKQAVEMERTH
ncbi:MAG: DUF1573 domain-containing protein [Flavobacteriales bacterium]|nr:DUF1573 domain-containing protein [Flavobacteriales bacterium]